MEGGIELDEFIWRDLPIDVLELVVSFLPIRSCFRFRSVNKHFHERGVVPKVYPRDNLLLVVRRGEVAGQLTSAQTKIAYDPSLNKWHKLPLVEETVFERWHHFYTHYNTVVSHGGLLCTVNSVHQNLYVVIYNPLTNTMRELPPVIPSYEGVLGRESFDFELLGLAVDNVSKGFKVLIEYRKGTRYWTAIYDSSTKQWTRVQRTSTDTIFFPDETVITCNGGFYALTNDFKRRKVTLLTFNLKQNSWTSILLPWSPYWFCDSCSLTESKGRILFVASFYTESGLPVVRIWELRDHGMGMWDEVTTMPRVRHGELIKAWSTWCPISCVGLGNLVCLFHDKSNQVLAFNLFTLLWFWLPPIDQECNFLPDDYWEWVLSFEPRFDRVLDEDARGGM